MRPTVLAIRPASRHSHQIRYAREASVRRRALVREPSAPDHGSRSLASVRWPSCSIRVLRTRNCGQHSGGSDKLQISRHAPLAFSGARGVLPAGPGFARLFLSSASRTRKATQGTQVVACSFEVDLAFRGKFPSRQHCLDFRKQAIEALLNMHGAMDPSFHKDCRFRNLHSLTCSFTYS